MVHRAPVHVDGHEQTFPALQVPPFEQAAIQTANEKKITYDEVQLHLIIQLTC